VLGTHDLGWFVVAGLLLNVTPGADFLYIVSRASAHGFAAGAWAALGIAAGIVVHVLAAALGLSAILATSATAFAAVKLAGAAYLVYLGVSMLWKRAHPQRNPLPPAGEGAAKRRVWSRRAIFAKGFLTNALNPKVALFFVALVPQFVDADAPSTFAAFVLLGAIFDVNGTLWNIAVAWTAARAASRLRATTEAMAWLERAAGALFVILGVKLALAER
jgi:threonine/homoserine/homoserine lactone efflux protein